MMNDIILEYSGWIRINPENIRFEYIGQDDMPQNIDGVQWQALSEDEQSDYIIEDAIAAIRDLLLHYRGYRQFVNTLRFECRSSPTSIS